jgi:hypothetical protein
MRILELEDEIARLRSRAARASAQLEEKELR